jgi:hypothetical protein
MSQDLSNILDVLMAKAVQRLRSTCIMPRLVNTDFADTPAGLGDTVNVVIPSSLGVSDVTASPTQVTPNTYAPQKVGIPLNRWRKNGYFFTDKERGELSSVGTVRQQDVVIGELAEDVDAYILGLYTGVYGYVGTAGTTPFATDLTAAKSARTLLNKYKAPLAGRNMVLDPDAEGNAVILPNFVQANFAGDTGTIREGQIGHKLGMDWWMDQQVPTHTSTPLTAGACTVNGVNAVGAGSTDGGRNGTVSIAKATNASDLVKGDIITIAGDSQTYVVTADTTLGVGNTSVPISPALVKATTGGETVTLAASHVVNLCFHPDAIAFASRRLSSSVPSAQANTRVVADSVSGLTLRMEMVRQNKQDYIEFDILLGAALVRPELITRVAG